MAYQEGDPGHLSVHNALRAELDEAATQMGVEVVLPDEAVAGQTGHVDAHNLITDALAKIANEGSAGASWAQVISAPDAVTSSYFDDKGQQWQYWEWNAAGTFDVEVSGGLLWVLCVGGAAHAHSEQVYLNQGQPGLVNEGLWEFGPGTHTVTVGDRGKTHASSGNHSGKPSSIGDYGNQGEVSWGSANVGRGSVEGGDATVRHGYKSSITGDELEYAPGYQGPDRPGRGNYLGTYNAGCVIVATRIDVPTLPPAPPRLEVAPVVAKPVSISGPAVQEWLVRDKQNNRKVVYFLPGNTGTARSLGLTEEGAEALQARRDVLDAIATTDVPEDFTGDPVTLLPKKLRGELTGFVEVRNVPAADAIYSVTLGAGVLPGVMVAAGGQGGNHSTMRGGPGGAGGVIGQGAHVPVILPVQGTATYTITVPPTGIGGDAQAAHGGNGRNCTIAVQGQTPFAAAVGGGKGCGSQATGFADQPGSGGSGGGSGNWTATADATPGAPGFCNGGNGIAGQGFPGGAAPGGPWIGGGGGYSERGHKEAGGKGFDLATALNLDSNDGITGSFLDLVSDDGWIAGGGSFTINGVQTYPGGGGGHNGTMSDGKPYTGGGGSGGDATPHLGGCGAVYIITDPT